MRLLAVGAVLAVIAIGCASSDGPTTVAVDPTTSTAPPTTAPDVTAPGHDSVATVVIADQTWEFDASCALPGEGEVIVWGTGEDPETGRPAELLLEASAAAPYVGISAGGRLLEAALDGPLVLTVDAGTVRGDDITFVADADIETGEGTPAGQGSVLVECAGYESSPTLDG